MSETVVDGWLKEAARLGREMGSTRVDMSPEAIDARLREVAELTRVCLELEAIGRP